MIDTSKIRPGDAVTIAGTVLEWREDTCIFRIEVKRHGGTVTWLVSADAIASHTPAPWVPEKGDVVWWNGKTGGPNEWEVLAVNGRYAWVGRVGDPDTNFPCLHCNLTLIRKGAANGES